MYNYVFPAVFTQEEKIFLILKRVSPKEMT